MTAGRDRLGSPEKMNSRELSEPYELFVMLAWHPVAGYAAYPVGVLALTATAFYVTWVPMTYEKASSWRRRLASPPDLQRVRAWLQDNGAVQLTQVEAPGVGLSPAEAAEEVLDRLLAHTIPALEHPRGM